MKAHPGAELSLRLSSAADFPAIREFLHRHQVFRQADRLPDDELHPDAALAFDSLYGDTILKRSISALAFSGEELQGLAIATPFEHWVDGHEEGLLHTLFVVPALSRHGCMAALVRFIERESASIWWRGLRAQLSFNENAIKEVFEACGWEFSGVEVHKVLCEQSLQGIPSFITLRRAYAEDEPVVLSMLAEANWLGFSVAEHRQFSRAGVAQAVAQIFSPLLRPDLIVIVAESSDGVIGHSTAQICYYEPLLGAFVARLHDTFVFPAYRNLGIATILTRAAEIQSFEVGLRHMVGTVSAPTAEGIEAILISLAPSGWEPVSALYRKPRLKVAAF